MRKAVLRRNKAQKLNFDLQLYATVDTTEGQLRGESTILVLRTQPSPSELSDNAAVKLPGLPSLSYYEQAAPAEHETSAAARSNESRQAAAVAAIAAATTSSTQRAVASDDEPNDSTIFRAELQAPHLDARHIIRTTLSWLDHPKCSSQQRDFDIRLNAVRCGRPLAVEQLVSQCVASLEHLYFNCDYIVEVRDTEDRQVCRAKPSCLRSPSRTRSTCDGARQIGSSRISADNAPRLLDAAMLTDSDRRARQLPPL